MVGVYAIYGQYHADPSADENIVYHEAPVESPRWVISSIFVVKIGLEVLRISISNENNIK
jgi:hypothetical protein